MSSLENVFGKGKEEELYNTVLKVLEQKFKTLGHVYLENTLNKRFSEELKEQLDDYSLFILKVESMSPDLTGYAIKKETYREDKYVIVVEIKRDRPTLKDIYQTKRYAEILQATHALLISPKKLSAERRRFLLKRKEQITLFSTNKQVLIGQLKYDKNLLSTHPSVFPWPIQIDKDLYWGLPEPFKEESK